MEEGVEEMKEPEAYRILGEQSTQTSIKQDLQCLPETEAAIMKPVRSVLGPLYIYIHYNC